MANQNQIFLNPAGYIELTVIGDQTYDTFHDAMIQAQPLIQKLKNQGKSTLGLIDLVQKGKYTPGSNKAAMEALENIDYDKIAMFGADMVLKEVTEMIILAMGKKENTQLFHDRQAAVEWLLKEEANSQASIPVGPKA